MRTKLLIFVIIIAALFRFIGLGSNPPSLNWDEIAIGWNAYSILHTGKDEFGEFLPLTFRSFDDYKSPAYIYATIPALIVFGKSEFAVRFASAFTGTLTVLLMYYLTRALLYKKLTDQHENAIWYNRTANIGLFAAGILAITPWHVHFSRVAFEANFALFWEVLGAYLFLKWIHHPQDSAIKSRHPLLAASVISFAIALYSYANARLFIPLLLLGWAIYFFKVLIVRKKEIIVALIGALLITLPLILQMLQGTGLARFQATSIVNRLEIFEHNKEQAVEDYKNGDGQYSVLVHNFRLPLFRQIFQNYFDHFAYSFLFVKSDLPRHQVPGFGLLYPWQLPLLIIGLVFILKFHKSFSSFLPLWWLLIAPIPAAITWQVPHSIRSELMLPMLTVASAAGLWQLLKLLQQIDLTSYTRVATSKTHSFVHTTIWLAPKVTFLATLTFIGFSASSLATNYHTHLPAEFGKYWLYGRKEMVEIVESEKNNYDQVVVDLSVEWAYLWFLWYGNYTPQQYLSQGGTVSGGFADERNKIGNIKFKKFDFNPVYFGSEKGTPNTLYVGISDIFSDKLVPYKRIDDPGGKPVLYIVKS